MKKFFKVVFLLIILSIIGFFLYVKGIPQTTIAKISHDTARFTGVVTETNFGCIADGVCYIVVDGDKKIITMVGWSQQIGGQIINPESDNTMPQEGSTIEAYVRKVEGGYDLYGSRDYYIKVLNN